MSYPPEARRIEKLRGDCEAWNRAYHEATGRLQAIAEIIEAVDSRCATVDGPVRPTLQEIRETELLKIYELAKGKPP